jgi:intein/homing endonuclease
MKKGVAQMLQRLTYIQTISTLRKVNSPTVDASTNKLTSPRHLHNTLISGLCVTGETQVLLSDGVTLKRIDQMTNNDKVMTVNKNDLSTEPSKIYGYFKKMPNKLLKITTISGREIKCTIDHPLLIKKSKGKYEMIKAGDIKEGQSVVIKHSEMIIEDNTKTSFMIKESDVIDRYKTDLLRANVLDREFTQTELEIMARLVGLNVTDGHLSKAEEYYNCVFSVGEEQDAYDLVDDIIKLGFSSPSVKRKTTHYNNQNRGCVVTYKTWRVVKNGAFAYFMNVIGGILGNKTEATKVVPKWIKNANKKIIREYLSGFQGGDGCRLSIQVDNNTNRTKLNYTKTQQTTVKS